MTTRIDGKMDTVLYGAFHHVHSDNPRYKLNTERGRFETIDETVNPTPLCETNDDGEPEWSGVIVNVILTFDNSRVVGIERGRYGKTVQTAR